MNYPLPSAALAQHIAFLGKTGSGKTTSAKGAIEHIVRRDPHARVCVLDPVKSDWWGMISSADGREPGLPFHILGGPRGHVPVHESAGKAIGEIVGNGALRLSIVDMKFFKPGGRPQFFNDFVPSLTRHMRGVVYLVLEEAHVFAPKERSGIGNENMAVHWAKEIATAGRSMGIRMIVCTQRTQALHNALLGSCDTMVAHRMTAPADQAPVKLWLKDNVSKEIFEQVAGSMSSLRTGTGWVCSGEAQFFQLCEFPKLTTYDNTRTPTGQEREHKVTTAPVDAAALRAIVGDAVKEAEENDPATLRKRIRELEVEVAKKPAGVTSDEQHALIEAARTAGWHAGHVEGANAARRMYGDRLRLAAAELETVRGSLLGPLPDLPAIEPPPKTPGIVHRQQPYTPPPASTAAAKGPGVPPPDTTAGRASTLGGGSGAVALPKAGRLILTALAQHGGELPIERLAAIAGYSASGGGFRNALGALRSAGHVDGLRITDSGVSALGHYDPLPTGPDLLRYWMGRVGKAERSILEAASQGISDPALVAAHGGYEPTGGGWRNALGRLRTLGLVSPRGAIELHEDLR